jgi:hypothetical protein
MNRMNTFMSGWSHGLVWSAAPSLPRGNSHLMALTLAALLLWVGCAGERSHLAPDPSASRIEAPAEATSEDALVFSALPTNFAPVRVGQAEFLSALTGLVLEMPLPVASSPLYPDRWPERACSPPTGEAWNSELARAYGSFCARRGTPGDCLTLFDDGPHLRSDDKRRIALAVAVGPALEGLDAEVRAMLSPTRLLSVVSVGIAAYMALLVAPEPVSKGVAGAFSLLLWGYLGWEFWELLQAYIQLVEDVERATTFEQLREAGERFGRVIGPNSVRILVMVGTAAVGETAALLPRLRKLPSLGIASRNVEAHSGLRLAEAATGAEKVIISVPERTLRVVVPPNTLAKTPRGALSSSLPPHGHLAFRSFKSFKRHMGSAGNGKQWHHVVEQHKGNQNRFGPEALHNTENVIPLDAGLHTRVSAFYSSVQRELTGSTLTVRQWLSTQPYEAQREFGLRAIENIRKGIWR